jgi:formate/nitrite transporter FocA (FNT family)
LDTEILKFFGIDAGAFIAMSTIVYLLVQALKEKLSTMNIDGAITSGLSFIIAIGVVLVQRVGIESLPEWSTVVVLGLLLWLVPSGINGVIKKVKGP